jgi:hypothetical protein
MCPHATIYVSSCYYICVLILLYMCPHATIYVSSCYIHLSGHLPAGDATEAASGGGAAFFFFGLGASAGASAAFGASVFLSAAAGAAASAAGSVCIGPVQRFHKDLVLGCSIKKDSDFGI